MKAFDDTADRRLLQRGDTNRKIHSHWHNDKCDVRVAKLPFIYAQVCLHQTSVYSRPSSFFPRHTPGDPHSMHRFKLIQDRRIVRYRDSSVNTATCCLVFTHDRCSSKSCCRRERHTSSAHGAQSPSAKPCSLHCRHSGDAGSLFGSKLVVWW